LKWFLSIIFICTFVFMGIFADDVVYQNDNAGKSDNLTISYDIETVTDINGTTIQYVKNELIIQFKPEFVKDQISYATNLKTTHAGINATIIEDYGAIGMPGVQLIQLPENVPVDSAIQYYLSCPSILYAEPNEISEIAPPPTTTEVLDIPAELNGDILKGQPNDPEYPLQWGLRMVNAQDTWDYTTGSDNVIIAVIDSGVDYNHPDLMENIWRNSKEIPNNGFDDEGNGYIDDYRGWNFILNNNNPMDDNGHGTHCAGIIAARGNNNIGITGTLWNAKIVPLKVNNGQNVDTASKIKAIQYANSMNADIISCSFGSASSSSIERNLIENSQSLFICAAGNDGENDDLVPYYPACYDLDNIISVAATDPYDKLTSFSNYGINTIHIGAPGENILSTLPDNRYGFDSGTSMATPFVTGVAGLIKSKHPELTNAEVKAAIINNVDIVVYLNGKITSGGRLNAYKALKSLEKMPTMGSISIQSNPAGATIFLDGINTGSITPDTIPEITAGNHTIRCIKTGYSDQTQVIPVIANQTTNVHLMLEIVQSNGSILVQSNPPGARIYIDNEDTGFITPKTLTNITTGSHVIRCTGNGYYDNSITVSVAPGQISNISLDLIGVVTSIKLGEGWNFVSVPLLYPQFISTDIAYSVLFSGIDNAGHSSWRYHADSRNWEKLYLNSTLSPLDGIWIYSATANTIPVPGDNSHSPIPKQLYKGWNAIGYAGQVKPASIAFTSLTDRWVMLFGYNSTGQQYDQTIFIEDPTENTSVIPGKGYWIYMDGPAEYSLPVFSL
jgi:thermitase